MPLTNATKIEKMIIPMTRMRRQKSRQTLLQSSIDDHQEQGDVVVDDAGRRCSHAVAAAVVEAGILFCPWFIIYRRSSANEGGSSKIVGDSYYLSPWFNVHRPFIVHSSSIHRPSMVHGIYSSYFRVLILIEIVLASS